MVFKIFFLHKSKEKLSDYLLKQINFYGYECWRDSLKEGWFANKIENINVSIYKSQEKC